MNARECGNIYVLERRTSISGHGDYGDEEAHAAAHARAEDKQAAGTLSNIIIKTGRAHFLYL